MIYRSKAPLRLGLAGGGSDVSPYSDMYGGLVLNATINLYTYCTIRLIDEREIRIHSYDTNTEEAYELAPYIEPTNGAILIKGAYNRIVKDFGYPNKGFEITTYNDAPIGSGLGTSSSMVVCILKAFTEWLQLPLGDYEISRLAFEIERHDLKLSGGKQDQYAAAFGGFNYMEFHKDDLVIVNPLKIKRWIVDELEASMVLYFTGASRRSAEIINEQKANTSKGNNDSVRAMHKIKKSAEEMKRALLKGDILRFSEIVKEGWENKKKMASSMSNPMIEEAFEVAIPAGAYSGKVSGAGGGGFIMFMVDPTKKKAVIEALGKLSGFVMPFQFTDGGAHGWRIYKTDKV